MVNIRDAWPLKPEYACTVSLLHRQALLIKMLGNGIIEMKEALALLVSNSESFFLLLTLGIGAWNSL